MTLVPFTIFKYSMSGRTLYKKLITSIEESSKSAHLAHNKDLLKKQDALVHYRRMQYMQAGKTLTTEDDSKLVEEVKKQFANEIPKVDISMVAHLDKDSLHPVEVEHINNLSLFLDSQREYVALLERYNPGISMKQTDKVKKTARRVGLEVPK